MIRPVIFFTVQKSRDRRRMIATKLPMKLEWGNQPHSKYAMMARVLKRRWKKVTTGCLILHLFSTSPKLWKFASSINPPGSSISQFFPYILLYAIVFVYEISGKTRKHTQKL